MNANACGIDLLVSITEQRATDICNEFNLAIQVQYGTGIEKRIGGREHTYRRNGSFDCIHIQVERKGDNYLLRLRGSLHKLRYIHNNEDFSISELNTTIECLADIFSVNPSECEVKALEVGINIPVWFPVYDYLKSNLLFHKKKQFMEFAGPKSGMGFQVTHEDYLIKVYQKAVNVMRVELKATSKDKLQVVGITHLSDLKKETVGNMADLLLKEWNEVIMRDGFNVYDKKKRKDGLKVDERLKVLEYSSMDFISSYNEKLEAANKKERARLRQEAYRLKKSRTEIIRNYGNGYHGEIGKLISFAVDTLKKGEPEYHRNDHISDFDKVSENVTTAGQIVKRDIIEEDCINLKLIKVQNTGKSKKQEAKEKRERDQAIRDRFMYHFKKTLAAMASN